MEQISREFREICSIILFYRHKSPFAHCAISLFTALGIGSGNIATASSAKSKDQLQENIAKERHHSLAPLRKYSAGCPFRLIHLPSFVCYLRKVSSMFSISSRNVASVANWRSIFLQLWRMVEWSRPPSSRPIWDSETSVNFCPR